MSRALRRKYEAELLCGQTADTLASLLESVGVTRRELARRLDISPGRVSQLLSGAANLTLRTVAEITWALGYHSTIRLEPMADRSTTPAAHDRGVPAWLLRLQNIGASSDLASERDDWNAYAIVKGGQPPSPQWTPSVSTVGALPSRLAGSVRNAVGVQTGQSQWEAA